MMADDINIIYISDLEMIMKLKPRPKMRRIYNTFGINVYWIRINDYNIMFIIAKENNY